jgi:hypothetical protein
VSVESLQERQGDEKGTEEISPTPGDTSMATRKEVEKQIAGGGARVVR